MPREGRTGLVRSCGRCACARGARKRAPCLGSRGSVRSLGRSPRRNGYAWGQMGGVGQGKVRAFAVDGKGLCRRLGAPSGAGPRTAHSTPVLAAWPASRPSCLAAQTGKRGPFWPQQAALGGAGVPRAALPPTVHTRARISNSADFGAPAPPPCAPRRGLTWQGALGTCCRLLMPGRWGRPRP
jgi:hypothetical protein